MDSIFFVQSRLLNTRRSFIVKRPHTYSERSMDGSSANEWSAFMAIGTDVHMYHGCVRKGFKKVDARIICPALFTIAPIQFIRIKLHRTDGLPD